MLPLGASAGLKLLSVSEYFFNETQILRVRRSNLLVETGHAGGKAPMKLSLFNFYDIDQPSRGEKGSSMAIGTMV